MKEYRCYKYGGWTSAECCMACQEMRTKPNGKFTCNGRKIETRKVINPLNPLNLPAGKGRSGCER